MQKINGFNRSPHPFQIISYGFFICLILTYYFVIFPLSGDIAKVVSIIIESIAAVGIVISGYMATAIDPSDPFLQASRKARFEKKPYEPAVREFYCGADHTYVRSNSKHCRRCNRCTEEFDHHCKWINNDVGKANYKPFFMMISSVMVFLITYVVFAVILTVKYANDHMLVENNTYFYASEQDKILAGMVILWIIMVPASAFLILDINLVLFHIFLKMKGLTTFQYISIVEERKETMKELEEAIKMLGGNKKTCLDFILCLKKREPRAPSSANTGQQEIPKTAELEMGRTSSFEKKKVSDVLDENKNPNRSISKIGIDESPGNEQAISKSNVEASPNYLESPSTNHHLYPAEIRAKEQEVACRDANVSREVNYNGGEPVVINITRDQEGKRRNSTKKHTISQVSVEINKEEEDAQARHSIKILTPNSSKQRVQAYTMGGEDAHRISQKNTRGSQLVEVQMKSITSQTVDMKASRPNLRNKNSSEEESYRGAEL